MTWLTRSWLGSSHRSRRPVRRHRPPLLAAALVAPALLAGCSGTTSSARSAANPPAYAATLWAQRPVVRLAFDVAADLHTVSGRESVRFTPDAATCELDFRAYPNEPTIAAAGSALSLTAASVAEHPVSALVSADGAAAGAPGALIWLPLSQCLQSGQSVDAELGFTVTLGRDADERVGYSPATGTAWFGSAFPLLSWVRGQGWSNDPAVAMNGETAVSVEFQLVDLAVTAPDGDQVSGSARPDRPTRDHHPPLHGRVGARRSGRRRPEQANSG